MNELLQSVALEIIWRYNELASDIVNISRKTTGCVVNDELRILLHRVTVILEIKKLHLPFDK